MIALFSFESVDKQSDAFTVFNIIEDWQKQSTKQCLQQACKRSDDVPEKIHHHKLPVLQTVPKTNELNGLKLNGFKSLLWPVNRWQGTQTVEQTLAVEAETER